MHIIVVLKWKKVMTRWYRLSIIAIAPATKTIQHQLLPETKTYLDNKLYNICPLYGT